MDSVDSTMDLLVSLSDEEDVDDVLHMRGTQEISNAELIKTALDVGNQSFFDCNKESTNNAYLRKVHKFKVILLCFKNQNWCNIRRFEDNDIVTEEKLLAWLIHEIVPMVNFFFKKKGNTRLPKGNDGKHPPLGKLEINNRI